MPRETKPVLVMQCHITLKYTAEQITTPSAVTFKPSEVASEHAISLFYHLHHFNSNMKINVFIMVHTFLYSLAICLLQLCAGCLWVL